MTRTVRFAVNRICAAQPEFEAFCAMAQGLGAHAIELRNDLAGAELCAGTPAREVGAIARAHGLALRSINALQRFEQYDAERAREAEALARYAADSGTEALVLCPTNSRRDARAPGQRHDDLVHALRQLQPMLADAGLVGLIEPLGFEECALRSKAQAARAMAAVGGAPVFALVHDTFHHHLAGDPALFPELTGLVHVSGVEQAPLAVADMRDAHRVLVGPTDRLGNLAQLRSLLDAGYDGYLSFEPFAAEITAAPDIGARLRASMDYLSSALADSDGAAGNSVR